MIINIIKSQKGEIITPLLFVFLIFMIIVISIYSRAVHSLANVDEKIKSIQESYNKKCEKIEDIYLSKINE